MSDNKGLSRFYMSDEDVEITPELTEPDTQGQEEPKEEIEKG
jgi:hypothetical protein